ncbi:hypothetical protein D3C80_984300 [compost metagenome]
MLEQLGQGLRAQLQGAVRVGVVLADQQGQLGAVARCLAAGVDRLDQAQAALLVGDVPRPFLRVGQPLAQVVQQAGPAHGQRLVVLGALAQGHQHVLAGVDLRVMQGRLRHAEQRLHLRQQLLQGAAIAQHLDEHLRARFHQRAGDFLPDALGGQLGQFAGGGDLGHQRQGLLGHAKAQRRVARGEAGDAQHAQRVLGEGRRDVAQQAQGEVVLAAVGIDQATLGVLGDGVDGQVAADQVFLEGDLGAGVEGEAAVAASALALGARQGVLLAALRVEEYRKVGADRAVALGDELFGAGADHHPVGFRDGAAEQAVAHGAAHLVDLHDVSCEQHGIGAEDSAPPRSERRRRRTGCGAVLRPGGRSGRSGWPPPRARGAAACAARPRAARPACFPGARRSPTDGAGA